MADPALPTAESVFGPAPLPTAESVFGPPPGSEDSVPMSVFQRISTGMDLEPIITKAAKGFAQGAQFGTPLQTLSPEEIQTMKDAGWYPTNNQGFMNGLRMWPAVAANAAAATGDLLTRMFQGGLAAISAGGEQALTQVGVEKQSAQQLMRDLTGYAEMEGIGAGPLLGIHGGPRLPPGAWRGPMVSRMEMDPVTGKVSDVPVGTPPTMAEAGAQADRIADNFGLSRDAAEAIKETYRQTGRMPAEVFADMHSNPEVFGDIANGNIPQVYAGPPKPVTAMPNVAPEEFARISQEATLKDRQAGIQRELDALPPGDAAAADRLNRLQAVESQLADPKLEPAERKALLERRDQILTDTTPEALKAAAAPFEQRRALEAQQANIASQLEDLAQPKPVGEVSGLPQLQAGEAMPLREAPKQPEAAPGEAPAAPAPEAPAPTPEATAAQIGGTEAPAAEAAPAAPAAPRAEVQRGSLRNVQGTGEEVPLSVVETMQENTAADLGPIPTRQRVEDAVQIPKAQALIASNPGEALDVAMGRKAPRDPEMLPEFVLAEMARQARAAGDTALQMELAKSRLPELAATMGARTSAYRHLLADDPVTVLQQVNKTRAEAVDAKLAAKGTSLDKEVAAQVKEAKEAVKAERAKPAVKKVRIPRDRLAEFIAEITCK